MPKGRDLGQRIDEGLAELRSRSSSGEQTHGVSAISVSDDPYVRLDCQEAGLDATNPAHLRDLLLVYAAARHAAKPPGIEKHWDSIKLSQLLLLFVRSRMTEPRAKDLAICTLIAADRRIMRDGRQFKPETLLRVLQDATNQGKNRLLRHVLASLPEHVLQIMNDHRRHGPLPAWQSLPDCPEIVWHKV